MGFSLKIDGVLVEEIGTVDTAAGKVDAQTDLEKGDIIVRVGDCTVRDADELDGKVEACGGERLQLTVNRGGDTVGASVQPLKESLSGRYRLGIWVKERINGIGTVSFINGDMSFAALGHPISANNHIVPVNGGDVYGCDIIGVTKGRRGQPGEIKGVLKNKIVGSIDSNTAYGIYGKLNAPPRTELYELAGRDKVVCGKAKIYTTIGDTADFYDIEIVRAMGQNKRSDKSMVIRVTDKRLIKATGGIIQGMSGSPILQNNMIVGAVTHVFVNDPLKGYGIYADWLCG